MEKITQTIQCPECKSIQQATVEHTVPWPTYIHECSCGHLIMESEWNLIKNEKYANNI